MHIKVNVKSICRFRWTSIGSGMWISSVLSKDVVIMVTVHALDPLCRHYWLYRHWKGTANNATIVYLLKEQFLKTVRMTQEIHLLLKLCRLKIGLQISRKNNHHSPPMFECHLDLQFSRAFSLLLFRWWFNRTTDKCLSLFTFLPWPSLIQQCY